MPKVKSQNSDYDSDEDQKVVFKKPKVSRLDKIKNVKRIIINLSMTQYQVIADVAEQLNWKVQYDNDAGDWDVYWTDIPIDTDTLIKMHLFQKINYYPGIFTIARKNLLGLKLMSLKQKFPQDYDFFPMTWMLPQQYAEFRQYYENKPQGKIRTYIVKPEADCQGRGIFLTRKLEDLQNGKHYVVQRYITKPYLIDNLKFDLRIYVLLCGTNPLRLYIYEDGLGRFATQKYVEPSNQNLDQQFMHLTNYAINKRSPKYVFNSNSANMGIGHKRSLKSIYQQLKRRGVNVQILKQKINDLIIKTVISGLPLMSHQYRCCQPQDYVGNMCFHVLGFDVMLNQKEEPQLIQVNHTPSYATDTPLDYKIKFALVKDTLKIMRITTKQKTMNYNRSKEINASRLHNKKRNILQGQERDERVEQEQEIRRVYQDKHLGGYSRIYPIQGDNKEEKMKYYQNLIEGAAKVHYNENTPIRLKMEEIQKKKFKAGSRNSSPTKKLQRQQRFSKHKKPHHLHRMNTLKTTQRQVMSPEKEKPLSEVTPKSKRNFSQCPDQAELQDLVLRRQSTDEFLQDCSSAVDESEQTSKDRFLSELAMKQRGQLQSYEAELKQKFAWSEAQISLSDSKPVTKKELRNCQRVKRYDKANLINKFDLRDNYSYNNIIHIDNNLKGKIQICKPTEKEAINQEGENQPSSLQQSCSRLLNPSEIINSQKEGEQRSLAKSNNNLSPRSATLLQRQTQLQEEIRRRKISKEVNQYELPKIYDNSSCDVGGQAGVKGGKLKNRSTSNQPRILNSNIREMRLITLKNMAKQPQNHEQKRAELDHIISRKINTQSKRNKSQNSFNKETYFIGSGEFIMPKMYQLNMIEMGKRNEASNAANTIAKSKNLKSILPL